MRYRVFKSTMPALATITKFTTAALLLVALAACGGGGSGSGTKKAKTIPEVNLKVTGVNGGVDLSWDAVENATSYNVYYSEESFDKTNDGAVDSTTDIKILKASITGLANGTKYYLQVAAISDKGNLLTISKIVTATAAQAPNLIATGVNKAIDLSWDRITHATSYTIYYHTSDFDSSTDSGVQSQAGITATSTRIADLTNGTTYYFRAIAKYQGGDSNLSEIVSATANLEAPINLQVTGKDKAIDISWDAVTGATSYTVYYSKDSSTIKVNSQTAATNFTSIKGLTDGTKYSFSVIAINKSGSSAMSQIKSATTKRPAPRPSAAASISLAAVDLTWETLGKEVTGYKVYYAKDSLDKLEDGYLNYASASGGKVKTITDTSATGITIGDLSANTTYYFVVTASYKGQKGESAAPEVSADSSYIAELAIGGYHSCVRLNTGSIKCWGDNELGQLGVGSSENIKKTANSVSNFRAKQLSAGVDHSCAIDLEGGLYCWGYNGYGQLGLIDSFILSPTRVTQLANVSLVDAGSVSTCALADGSNYCWGYQRFGALGNDVSSSTQTSTAQEIMNITSDVKQFAVGDYSGCAIDDASDDLWCWGYNENGEVGYGTDTASLSSPVKPKLLGGISNKATMVDGIYSHYCVVDDANKIQCWGLNDKGQLGIDSTTDSNSPQYVLASDSTSDHLTGVSKIATGKEHSCALIIDGMLHLGGSVRCWGESDDGIIGIAWQDDKTKWGPDRLIADTDMSTIKNAIDIAAGYEHTCVLLADKASVKCWGKNRYGQLGNNTKTNSATPVEVKGL